jgi:geranylgeranyl diphosphate synthase, type II
MLTKAIESALKKISNHPELSKVMEYAVLPAGKLFRPRIVEAIALDLSGELSENHLHLATAIELHHAYTLVHDDLPAMDNDLMRRGKASTHAHFGEWQAILAGDALLIGSFQEIALIKHSNFFKVHRLMTWATGAKGLIEGQFRDLKADGKLFFSEVVRIHELKTARLIQMATLGSYLLTNDQNFRTEIDFLKLGREIGVSFQLLDDLSELNTDEISSHEMDINPFINNFNEALKELKLSHTRLKRITSRYQLNNVDMMLRNYFKQNQTNLLKDFPKLKNNINEDLNELKNWLTNFV